MGQNFYAYVKTQLKPVKPLDVDFYTVVKAATTVYKQQLTIIGMKNKFMNRQRKSSESVAQFALALREFCGGCDYPRDYQDQALRDMFVKRLNLTAVQAKLMMRDERQFIEV